MFVHVTGILVAIAHPHGAASTVGTGTYWFAIGLLAGVAACMFAPGWLTAVIVVFDLVALGWTAGILDYTHSASGRWVLIAVPFLLIGLFFGVLRGLRHLGDWEFGNRKRGVRGIGRYF